MLTWTILGVVVAIIGVALYFLTRMWVNKRVESELLVIKSSLKDELKNELKNELESESSILKNSLKDELKNELETGLKNYVREIQPLKGASGNSTLIPDNGNNIYIPGINISGYSVKSLPHKLEVFSGLTHKKLDCDYELNTSYLLIKLKNFDPKVDGYSINWKLTWIDNELYV